MALPSPMPAGALYRYHTNWIIEGPNPPANPFLSSAPTTGYGAYAPSGISWYRKHFSLAGTPNTQKIYIEFDGVMQDASFYVNGKTIATHPYGYTSIQYDITSVTFTGDNVIAVKTDTSKQPAERFYKGAGIYRDVRLVVTNPVHIDQYGLYVSTPKVSSTTATVRVQVTVLNSGSSNMANASVNGVLSDPSDIAPAPVTATETQDVAAGARAGPWTRRHAGVDAARFERGYHRRNLYRCGRLRRKLSYRRGAEGMALSPARAGLVTEQTTNAALWDPVKANPALTGLFV